MATSAALWCAGDLAAQRLEVTRGQNMDTHSTAEHESIDWRRTSIQTFYASFIWAPLAHHWYILLDNVAHRIVKVASAKNMPKLQVLASTRPRLALVATKLVLENVALHPISLLLFFGCSGYMMGETRAEIQSQIRRDFLPTYALEVALWTPLDAFTFRFVPVRHQLLVANCGCFVESIGLSLIKKNGFGASGLD